MSDLTVMDFGATWCGPCKMMEPIFNRMKEKHPDVVFEKYDIDTDGTKGFEIRSVPYFVFKKGDKIIHEQIGVLNLIHFDAYINKFKETV